MFCPRAEPSFYHSLYHPATALLRGKETLRRASGKKSVNLWLPITYNPSTILFLSFSTFWLMNMSWRSFITALPVTLS